MLNGLDDSYSLVLLFHLFSSHLLVLYLSSVEGALKSLSSPKFAIF